jgi:GNAT superfamily N-acetyltransferase
LTSDFQIDRVAPERLHELRRRVLRSNNPDISVADKRDNEETAIHYAGLIDDVVVVSASFYPSVSPVRPELVTYQLRYMATDFDVQGKGLGRLVMNQAEDDLRALGVEQVWANGRDTALGFYKSLNWELVPGSEHLSPETQLPHTVIVKRLTEMDA